jgi:pimeloyl-ACP methyl ester carboxylesterase
VLGPAIERLRMTFPSEEAYLEFWRPHPALSEAWSEDVEAYLRYDLHGEPPKLRSRVSEEAVREDGVDTLRADALAQALLNTVCPITLLRAERDALNRPSPLFPEEAVAPWRDRLPHMKDEVVPDTNHYSLAVGERGAKTVAHHAMGAKEER